jgi:hypothetical protein
MYLLAQAQSSFPLIDNGWQLAGLVAILLFQFYQSRETKALRKGVNGRLEELLHTTRMRAHAEGHLAGVTYEQERKRLQLEASRNALFSLAKIEPIDPGVFPLSDTRAGETQPGK